jgi:hypothetical protein
MNRQVNIDNHPCLFIQKIFCSSLVGTTNEEVLKQYYYDAYGRIRLFSDCLLSISPLLYQQSPNASDWAHFMLPPQFNNIVHEWHRYQIWGFEVKKNKILFFYHLMYY